MTGEERLELALLEGWLVECGGKNAQFGMNVSIMQKLHRLEVLRLRARNAALEAALRPFAEAEERRRAEQGATDPTGLVANEWLAAYGEALRVWEEGR